jgi:hypothetical protein
MFSFELLQGRPYRSSLHSGRLMNLLDCAVLLKLQLLAEAISRREKNLMVNLRCQISKYFAFSEKMPSLTCPPVHQTLRVTPAMQAGITDHVWGVEELCVLLPKPTVSASVIERELLREALEPSRKLAE